MADPMTEISAKNGVSREEALFYLEGFNWDLNSATEACRTKTLPPLTVEESSTEIDINVKFAPDSPSTPPRTADSVRISTPTDEQQPPPQVRSERIRKFVETIDGTTEDEAVAYLTRKKWNVADAVGEFFDERNSTEMIDDDFFSNLASQSQHYPTRKGIQIGGSSSSSSLMEIDKTESLIEAAETIALIASQANVNQETSVPMVMDSRGGSNQVPISWEQQSQLKDTLIDSFLRIVDGVTREEAIDCLRLRNWDVENAVNYFYDDSSHGVFSDEETFKAMEMNWQENRNIQGHLEIGSSSSSVHADSTETGRPFDETGLVNVPVAVSGIAMSQVKNWNTEAVHEDSSTETGSEPLATQDTNIEEPRGEPITTEITFNVLLAGGVEGIEVEMTFRSDQTVRDIHNRIQEFRPDDNRNYFLRSLEDEDAIFNDLNTTVQRIYSRGATKLIQVPLSD